MEREFVESTISECCCVLGTNLLSFWLIVHVNRFLNKHIQLAPRSVDQPTNPFDFRGASERIHLLGTRRSLPDEL